MFFYFVSISSLIQVDRQARCVFAQIFQLFYGRDMDFIMQLHVEIAIALFTAMTSMGTCAVGLTDLFST